MIIRTFANSVLDTSKQRVIPDCCTNPKPAFREVDERTFTVLCLTCLKNIVTVIPERNR